jgi:hypothetical protein
MQKRLDLGATGGGNRESGRGVRYETATPTSVDDYYPVPIEGSDRVRTSSFVG